MAMATSCGDGTTQKWVRYEGKGNLKRVAYIDRHACKKNLETQWATQHNTRQRRGCFPPTLLSTTSQTMGGTTVHTHANMGGIAVPKAPQNVQCCWPEWATVQAGSCKKDRADYICGRLSHAKNTHKKQSVLGTSMPRPLSKGVAHSNASRPPALVEGRSPPPSPRVPLVRH